MRRSRFRRGCLVGAAMVLAASQARAEPVKVAVFDFQFARGTPVEPTEEDRARLKRTGEEFRRLLRESGRYTLVPVDAVADDIANTADLRACGGCVDTFGRKVGASATFVGEVQKVSNLILNMNVYFKSLDGDMREKAYSVDLRGNTDESFDRGIKYLVKNQLLERDR